METQTSTATRTNQQTIQQAFEDFKAGNISAVIDICADDVLWASYRNPDVPYSGSFYGKEGVQDFFSKLAQNVEYTNFEPREYIVQGDNIAVTGHHTGIVKSTGKTFDHDWCLTFKMNNGKVSRFFSYVDTRDHSQAFR